MYLDSSVIASLALVGFMIVVAGVSIKMLRSAIRRDAERARR
ncbi:hypothetical protein [Halomonas shantousis]